MEAKLIKYLTALDAVKYILIHSAALSKDNHQSGTLFYEKLHKNDSVEIIGLGHGICGIIGRSHKVNAILTKPYQKRLLDAMWEFYESDCAIRGIEPKCKDSFWFPVSTLNTKEEYLKSIEPRLEFLNKFICHLTQHWSQL